MASFFSICAHPNEAQRLEFGRKLGLDSKQVKFWFQNRRTQLKVIVHYILYFMNYEMNSSYLCMNKFYDIELMIIICRLNSRKRNDMRM